MLVAHDAFLFHSDGDALVEAAGGTMSPVPFLHGTLFLVGAGEFFRSLDGASKESLASLAGHRVEMVSGRLVAADSADFPLVVVVHLDGAAGGGGEVILDLFSVGAAGEACLSSSH